MKAAIYARYSTDRQRETSIEDQVRNCTRYAEREAIAIARVFRDKAISGAISARHEYKAMLDGVNAGEFDTVLVDDLSRLSRDDYEMKGLLRRFAWQRIRVIGVSEGYDNEKKGHKLHAGFKGLINEIFLDDLRDRTHRGMTGQALKGYNCGGRTFGYRNVPIEDPARRDSYGRPSISAVKYEVDDAQAAIVRNIYSWYAAGYSYKWIAIELNRQRLLSSRGGSWAVPAVKVILENEMYEGRRTWNKRVWVKHPDTGKRTYRKRPSDEWVLIENQELRIVEPDVIAAVRKRQECNKAGYAGAFKAAPAQKYLFSGVMICAECGGNFTLVANHRYGCAAYQTRGKQICENGISVSRHIVEERMLEHIKEQLLEPGNADKFKAMAAEIIDSRTTGARSSALKQQLEAVERVRQNVLAAIRQGIVTPSTKDELENAESEIACLNRELNETEKWKVMSFLPRAVERYEAAVQELEKRIEGHIQPTREIIKSLLGEKVRIHRRGDHLEAEIPNHMPAILAKALSVGVDLPGCGGGMCNKSTWVSLAPVPEDCVPIRHRDGSHRRKFIKVTQARV